MTRKQLVLALTASFALLVAAPVAHALPLSFTNINVSTSNQSRINIAATATLNGTPLVEGPQFASGGLNGDGSASALYNQTATNTPSNMATNLGLFSVGFPGGGEAQAANAVGLLNNNLAIAPGVGGASGTAPADYGLVFTSPQSVVVPPIDVSALGISGLTTLNLGTLTAINLNVALRNFAVDLNSPILPMSGGGTYPAHFDSTQVNISVSGTTDMSLTATLKQDNITDFIATGAALIALQQGLSGQGISITETANILGLSYQVGFGFSTTLPVTNAADGDASQGTVDHVGSNLRLTLPVKFDITPSTLPAPLNTLIAADFSMSGQLIGQAPFQVVPEPSSAVLSLAGLMGAGIVARRRRARKAS
ncbi:MAG TPA: PEP-CTERM sorting domain-containing protein [Pirellulales bacterium]|jgi:hypothetical protein